MYQFYYGNNNEVHNFDIQKNINDYIDIQYIRPSIWEEHCLECSAPLCFKNCVYYSSRTDGRCKRFSNGMNVSFCKEGILEEKINIQYRRWANMMTIIFPAFMKFEDYKKLKETNDKLGNQLQKISNSFLPVPLKWNYIRTREYIRRNGLRKLSGDTNLQKYFVFHAISYYPDDFKLIIEVYDDSLPVSKTSLDIKQGENLYILDQLDDNFFKPNYLIKVYPENNLEVELDILWCDMVAGKDKRKQSSKVKCLVWDLDNTLWDGIFIETDNPEELKLKNGVKDTIVELDRRGILHSIASKNDYDQVWSLIKKYDLDQYFLYPQINWGLKSQSIKQIALELNIGIDSIAFIDDSIFERNEVISVLPEVRVYSDNQVQSIPNLEEFTMMITEESKNRRSMYQAEQKRKVLQVESNSDITDFLRKCHLVIQIFEPKTEEEKLRCFELTVRTNQLNMSGNKYTQDEFNKILLRSNHYNFAFSCKDDYGEYGIVGFGQYYIENRKLVFTEFAMSCRVAKKYVESALFKYLLESQSCDEGIFSIKKTKKNILLRNTLEEIGFRVSEETDRSILYKYDKNLKNSDLVIILSFKNREINNG